MNDYFTKFIGELSNLNAHQTGRFWWTYEVDILNRVIQIVMRDRLSDLRMCKIVPYDYILMDNPAEQAKHIIENMCAEMEGKAMMTIEEAIDQLEELESDVWAGARDGRPIYVDDDDFRALQVAIEALKEKRG